MLRFVKYFCASLAVFTSTGCNESAQDTTGPSKNPAPSDSIAIDSKVARTRFIFDEDTVRRYEFLLDPDSLAKIDASPTREEYVKGVLVVDGDTMTGVGIRYKGAEGAWYGCVSGGPWAPGKKTCPLSMQVKVNYTNADTTFHGLKRFQFHIMKDDPSKLVERIGYWFYREMGVPAPRVVHGELWINGKYEGLYAHVEEIDGRFVKYNFQGGDGNLYKEVWPLAFDSSVQTKNVLAAALKTNEESKSVAMLEGFGLSMAAAKTTAEARSVLLAKLDVDQALRLAAVSYALDDDDGMFHWYAQDATSPTNARPHNFFWYENALTGKLHLIPWDLDKMLDRVATPDTFNAVELRDDFGETSHDCRNYGQDWRQRSAACDKVVNGLASFDTLYRAKLVQVYEGPFSRIDAMVAKWEAQLRPVIERNKDMHPWAIQPEEWKAGVVKTKSELAAAKAALAAKVGR